MITEKQLRRFLPHCEDPAGWVKPLNDALRIFEIKEQEAAAFLAQAAHESSSLNRTEENLRYNAKRITEVWPKQFASEHAAKLYAYNPQRLASKVYAGKNGNGPEGTADGYHFRGRGLFQITGRENYQLIGKELGIDLQQFPDALLERRYAALSAGAYWKLRVRGQKLDPETVTKAVTGSKIGLAERTALYKKALEILNVGSRDSVGSGEAAKAHRAGKGVAARKESSAKAKAPATAWLE